MSADACTRSMPGLEEQCTPQVAAQAVDYLRVISDTCLSCDDKARQSLCDGPDGEFLVIFWVLHFQRAACSTFQTCILNSH